MRRTRRARIDAGKKRAKGAKWSIVTEVDFYAKPTRKPTRFRLRRSVLCN